jgi:hypothetical protein
MAFGFKCNEQQILTFKPLHNKAKQWSRWTYSRLDEQDDQGQGKYNEGEHAQNDQGQGDQGERE